MARTEGQAAVDAQVPASDNQSEYVFHLKRKSNDIGWNWGSLCDPNDKNRLKCLLCGNENSGGINRFKQHLAHEGTAVVHCTKKKREKQRAEADLREDVVITGSREGSDAESKAASSSGGSPTQKLGPMDRWTRPINPKATKEEAKRQQSLNEALWKERTHQVHQYIARWVYTHGIPFNAVDNDEFIEMVEAIGSFGPGLRPPSQYDLREKLLKEEHARMKTLLLNREEEKNKNGCSVMTDAWTDMKRRTKTLMLEKRPNIFWSSCATHTINLMLQGIGSLPRFKKTIDQAKAFTIFVYGHHRTLACMRSFTLKKDIIRPGVTRFATSYLTLQSLMEKRDALRKMVTRKGKDAIATMLSVPFWKSVALCLKVFEPLVRLLRLVDGDVRPAMAFLYGELIKAKKEIKEAFGNVETNYKDVMAIVDKKMKGRLDSSLHVAAYLLNPYYSYRDAAIFDDSSVVEKFMLCCETFFEASWWRLYGGGAPNLQRMASRILSLTARSSRCERNWSTFEFIHTKRRNRLTTECLNMLVYVQFNTRLLSKKEKTSNKKSYEVLLSKDAAEAQDLHEEEEFESEDDSDYEEEQIPFEDDEDEILGANSFED
ncbi:hypothetical protein PVAP13_1NG245338 [Panicum virgatum]|uniref:Uncharacterized protein n=1 Tax=Panicum virgatum TaxID=38727 RepID=A0A8T0WZS2_PANVG|nr:hypothetical protein PVAP13_1NG245338 [Panicum virgatum]